LLFIIERKAQQQQIPQPTHAGVSLSGNFIYLILSN
jgi:hypothetical protein